MTVFRTNRDFERPLVRWGIAQTRTTSIPMEEVCIDGSISKDVNVVLSKWKSAFSSLFLTRSTENQSYSENLQDQDVNVNIDCTTLNEYISIFEVQKAV
jgi:hypothetical protein